MFKRLFCTETIFKIMSTLLFIKIYLNLIFNNEFDLIILQQQNLTINLCLNKILHTGSIFKGKISSLYYEEAFTKIILMNTYSRNTLLIF